MGINVGKYGLAGGAKPKVVDSVSQVPEKFSVSTVYLVPNDDGKYTQYVCIDGTRQSLETEIDVPADVSTLVTEVGNLSYIFI